MVYRGRVGGVNDRCPPVRYPLGKVRAAASGWCCSTRIGECTGNTQGRALSRCKAGSAGRSILPLWKATSCERNISGRSHDDHPSNEGHKKNTVKKHARFGGPFGIEEQQGDKNSDERERSIFLLDLFRSDPCAKG